MVQSRSPRFVFLAILIPILVLFLAIWGKLPLNDRPEYYAFIDGRGWAGIPNAWNVLSNLPFLYVGWLILKVYRPEGDPAYRNPGLLLALGMGLTVFGSSYFHADPNPETLFWDRLPMVVAFSGVFLLLVTDRFSRELSLRIFWPLLAVSIASVVYWKYGDNLRPYISLQFGLLIFTFAIAIFTRGNRIRNSAVFGMAGLYLAAKVLESNDARIFAVLGESASGHSLKHLLAALAVAVFVRRFEARAR